MSSILDAITDALENGKIKPQQRPSVRTELSREAGRHAASKCRTTYALLYSAAEEDKGTRRRDLVEGLVKELQGVLTGIKP